MMKIDYFIIVAAGTGSRYGAELPKQFCQLKGRPLLMTTIDNAITAAPEAEIILVLSSAAKEVWQDLCSRYNYHSPGMIVEGGATRAESVKNALKACKPGEGLIAVHDGARPLITIAMVDRLLKSITPEITGSIPVIPVTDSLRELTDNEEDSRAVDRSRFRAVQTPQLFRSSQLIDAYNRNFSKVATDDATIVQEAGYKIALADGDVRNIKVTYPGDLLRLENELS